MAARVAVVGAGPVGVVAAIACARKGMQVTLFEAERAIDHSPRAATTHPSTLEMLAELGLVDEFISLGLVARYFQLCDRGTLVAACDGGRSTVRKCLDIEFEGYTWPERFLVLTTLVDIGQALGCCERTYISDPEEWINLFKVTGDDMRGRWRAVFPTRESETDEEAF